MGGKCGSCGSSFVEKTAICEDCRAGVALCSSCSDPGSRCPNCDS